MVNAYYFLKASDDAASADFRLRWDDLGLPEIEGMVGYCQSRPFLLPDGSEAIQLGSNFPFDGIGEFQFRDLGDWRDGKSSVKEFYRQELAGLVDDEKCVSLLGTEIVVVDGGEFDRNGKAVKTLFFPQRKSGISRVDFQSYQRTTHAEIAKGAPGLIHYVLTQALDSWRDADEAAFDAVVEQWWSSQEDLEAGLASPEFGSAVEDAANFVNTDVLFGCAMVERRPE